MTQQDAFCQYAFGTDLVTIDTDSKLELIKELLSMQHVDTAWIGLEKNGHYGYGLMAHYAHHISIVNYAKDPHWGAEEPNGLPGENCVTVGDEHQGSYNDIDCWMQFAFFYNYDLNSPMHAYETNIMMKRKGGSFTHTTMMTQSGLEDDEEKAATNEWVYIMISVVCMIL